MPAVFMCAGRSSRRVSAVFVCLVPLWKNAFCLCVLGALVEECHLSLCDWCPFGRVPAVFVCVQGALVDVFLLFLCVQGALVDEFLLSLCVQGALVDVFLLFLCVCVCAGCPLDVFLLSLCVCLVPLWMSACCLCVCRVPLWTTRS